jgi:hypothetical protein
MIANITNLSAGKQAFIRLTTYLLRLYKSIPSIQNSARKVLTLKPNHTENKVTVISSINYLETRNQIFVEK